MFALIIHLIFLNQIIIVDFVRGGSLKIALIGYGQMGQIVHKIAEKRNHEIVTIIDPITKPQTSFESIIDADICIDFSIPKSVINNIKKVSKLNKSIVINAQADDNLAYRVFKQGGRLIDKPYNSKDLVRAIH